MQGQDLFSCPGVESASGACIGQPQPAAPSFMSISDAPSHSNLFTENSFGYAPSTLPTMYEDSLAEAAVASMSGVPCMFPPSDSNFPWSSPEAAYNMQKSNSQFSDLPGGSSNTVGSYQVKSPDQSISTSTQGCCCSDEYSHDHEYSIEQANWQPSTKRGKGIRGGYISLKTPLSVPNTTRLPTLREQKDHTRKWHHNIQYTL